MRQEFNQEGSQLPKVFVSDCNGTLLAVNGKNFNDKLFDFLIEQKQEGHQVFIASNADSNASILRLQLQKRGLPKELFDVDHELVNPDNHPVVSKGDLVEILADLNIVHVDAVFDDEDVDYLSGVSVASKINPAIFTYEDEAAITAFKEHLVLQI